MPVVGPRTAAATPLRWGRGRLGSALWTPGAQGWGGGRKLPRRKVAFLPCLGCRARLPLHRSRPARTWPPPPAGAREGLGSGPRTQSRTEMWEARPQRPVRAGPTGAAPGTQARRRAGAAAGARGDPRRTPPLRRATEPGWEGPTCRGDTPYTARPALPGPRPGRSFFGQHRGPGRGPRPRIGRGRGL